MLAYKNKQSGMTTVELIVAISIATLIATSLTAVLTHIFSTRTSLTRQMMVVKQGQDAIDTISRDIRYTSRFLKSNSIPDVDQSWAPNGNWNFSGQDEKSRQLILEANATTKSYQNPDNKLVFEHGPIECTALAPYVKNNIIYFIKDGNLYRRTIVPQGVTACPEPIFQKQTCHNTGVDEACLESDVLIARNVSNFSVNYYNNPYDNSPFEAYNPGLPDDSLNSVSTIRINLSIKHPSAQNVKEQTTSILLSKGNI
ncbi:hypothetical protein GX865_03270 [Candidatus Saccharibacteria bacterium]|jgi:type II secretory pathway pseudopilin PulG|nr:hypothetical protein [Candidatus Saccharibacteria bacterium]